MGMQYTKLFQRITQSTVWCEDSETRIVWITMLALSDSRGRVFSSVPGLANTARVTVDQARIALAKFMTPDPDSTTPDFDGRRIEVIEGGWRLLNHGKYRALRDEEERKEYQREWVKSKRENRKNQLIAEALAHAKQVAANANRNYVD